MGKRSDFQRVERDFYPTPMAAVIPLLSHLSKNTNFVEPCAGNGALIDHLTLCGHVCTDAWDIEPLRQDIKQADALTIGLGDSDCFITNPPWNRKILHPMIEHLSTIAPTWLLFDADWIHTKQSIKFMPRLRKIISIGRVKWIPDSKTTGKDNCCWYLFDHPRDGRNPVFVPRQ